MRFSPWLSAALAIVFLSALVQPASADGVRMRPRAVVELFTSQSWGSSRIYTPQMVINGSKGMVGSRRGEVNGAIDRASLPLPIEVTEDGDMLKIAIPADRTLKDAVVWMVTYIDRADVAIERGNNAGKTMAYTQVVTGRQVLGVWECATGASIKLPIPEVLADTSTGIEVIVQQQRNGPPGPILGAAAFER
ncbi:MAG: DUF1223 domain-containing protein [Candidatus Devosia euplotis]|nr:DUF1223 domain-containing protein [Candidatus Devosia euplotis]